MMKRKSLLIGSVLFLFGFLCAITPTFAYNPNSRYADDLVAFWKFDDRINQAFVSQVPYGLCQDETINNNTGVLINEAFYTIDGKIGEAMKFESAQTQYVEVVDDPSLHFEDAFTVSFWFYKESDGVYGLISKAQNPPNLQGWFIGTGVGKLDFILFSESESYLISKTGIIEIKTWYFVSARYNGTGMALYLNGEVIAERNDLTSPLLNSPKHLLIGALFGNNPSIFLDGKMDEVAIFNRALNTTEIQSIYINGVPELTEEETDLFMTIYLPILLIGAFIISLLCVVFISKKKRHHPERKR